MHTTSTAVRIAFDDVGDGEPALFFLPGWCANRTAFRWLLEPAGRHRRALALDWRGHGGSERLADDYATDDLVDDAAAVIEASGAGAVVPVGLSHGGWVAVELRRRLGAARVPGMVLLDWVFPEPSAPFLEALRGLRDRDRWEAVRGEMFRSWVTDLDLPALYAHIGEMAEYGFDTWARAAREIGARFAAEGSPAAALERLEPSCPTLHVYAQPRDDDVLARQEAYARAHPWFRVRRLDARTHFPMFEIPGELAEVIEEFAEGVATEANRGARRVGGK
jgi:pimeloyl-ACP methyl ester carboxylesterase